MIKEILEKYFSELLGEGAADDITEEIIKAFLAMGDGNGLLTPEAINQLPVNTLSGLPAPPVVAKAQLALDELKHKGEIKKIFTEIEELFQFDEDMIYFTKTSLKALIEYQAIKAKYLGNEGER